MLDIVFVNPGDRKVVFQDLGKDLTAIEPPYLTLTFATYLQNKGFNVKIIDANALNITPEETAKIVKELNPRLVALIVYGNQPSASTQNMSIAGKIAKTIKMTISLPIVMGGLHPSALPKRTLEEESVDFVIQGEEQIPLEQLLIALQEETSFETVESLWYYDNEVIKNSTKGKLINNLDDYMPIANWDLLPMDKYRAHNWHCFDDIDKNTKILISVLQSSKTIEEDLKSKGFSNILSFANSIRLLPEFINILSKRNYLWLVEDKKRLLDIEKINLFKTFLKDIKSVDLLEKIVNFRKTFDMKYYIEPYDSEYFPSDVPIFNNISQVNFIDCGAYTGDTINDLMNYCSNVNYCLSFEPDLKNLENLNNRLESLMNIYPNTNFFVYPAGVYSSNKILSFSNQGIDSSASLVNSSDIKIPVVSLDTIILNANPNYIKMDIEGAEKEAIYGAEKTIKKHKPNLAICLYHKPEDLWELPLLINKIQPSYDMYLRVHEDLCLSTVLYCISKY